MTTYTGKKNQVYNFADAPLSSGSEGAIYEIRNDPNRLAKLYHASRLSEEAARRELLEKLEAMYSMPIEPYLDGRLKIAWVEDILFDRETFVGFVMSRVAAPYRLYDFERRSEYVKQIIPGYSKKNAMRIAYNLAQVVRYLHSKGVVIGDMNPNTVAVDADGEVAPMDCDSFDIRDSQTGKHYKCKVGMMGLLAPEIKIVDTIENADFTEASDDYSLAIHIYRLLMDGAAPFDTEEETYMTVAKLQSKLSGADSLHADIARAFERTFCYAQMNATNGVNERTTAEEWSNLLLKYVQE